MDKFPATDYNSAYSKATAEYELRVLRNTIKEQNEKIKEQRETIDRLRKELEMVKQDYLEALEGINDIEEYYFFDGKKI